MEHADKNGKLQEIMAASVKFHRQETEIDRAFDPSESILPRAVAEGMNSEGLTCYGIGNDVLRFIVKAIDERSHTMETGAGKSTLVFALSGARHIAVTPAQSEIEAIREYATQHDISLDGVTFVAEPSERFLPRCDAGRLDLVLIDGKHAFPWPIIDWFFTADRLRQGGIMLLDDVQMPSVSMLADFLRVDPGWKSVRDFSGKTVAFQKQGAAVRDVAWHMQPFNRVPNPPRPEPARGIREKIGRGIRRLIQP